MFIDTSKVNSHRTIVKFPLILKTNGVKDYSVHNIYLKVDDEDNEYFLFEIISGPAVMNWKPDDYKKANTYLEIGDTPIVMKASDGSIVNISTSYRK